MRLFYDFDILCTPKSNSNVLRKPFRVETQYQIQSKGNQFSIKVGRKIVIMYYFFKVLGVTAFRVGKREPLTFAYSAIKSTPHISLWLKESLILPEEFESTLIQGQNSKYSHYSMRAVPLKRDELEGN